MNPFARKKIASAAEPIHKAPPAEQPPATLDLIYNEIKASLEESSAQVSALDTKAGFVLTAASLLVTSLLAAQGLVQKNQTRHVIAITAKFAWVHNPRIAFNSSDVIHWLAPIAAAIYLWVVIFAWRGYMVREFQIISPERLYEYIDPKYTEEWQVKKMLTHAMRDRYVTNKAKIDLKNIHVELALRGLLVEGVFLAVILLLLLIL